MTVFDAWLDVLRGVYDMLAGVRVPYLPLSFAEMLIGLSITYFSVRVLKFLLGQLPSVLQDKPVSKDKGGSKSESPD